MIPALVLLYIWSVSGIGEEGREIETLTINPCKSITVYSPRIGADYVREMCVLNDELSGSITAMSGYKAGCKQNYFSIDSHERPSACVFVLYRI